MAKVRRRKELAKKAETLYKADRLRKRCNVIGIIIGQDFAIRMQGGIFEAPSLVP